MTQELLLGDSLPVVHRALDGLGHRPEVVVAGYNESDDVVEVSSMQKRLRDDFVSALNVKKWDVVTGSGDVWSYNSAAILVKGVVANSVSYLLSKSTFRIPIKFCFGLILSQRIANQTFEIGIVSVDESTGLPDEKYAASWLFDGAVNTTQKCRAMTEGVALDTTVTTTATTTHMLYDAIVSTDELYMNTATPDSLSAKNTATKKHQKLPDPDKLYKLRIRAVNGATAPASATTLTVKFVGLEDYAEVVIDTPALGGNSASQALPVTVTNSVSVGNTPSITPVADTTYTDSTTALSASASYSGTGRDAGSGSSSAKDFVVTAFADQAGTLMIQGSVDNTTWRTLKSVAVTAGLGQTLVQEVSGIRYYRPYYTNGATAQTVFLLASRFRKV